MPTHLMIARCRIYCFRFLSDNQCLSHADYADYRRDTRAIACVYHPVYSKQQAANEVMQPILRKSAESA